MEVVHATQCVRMVNYRLFFETILELFPRYALQLITKRVFGFSHQSYTLYTLK